MIQIQPKSSKFTVVDVNSRIETFLVWFGEHLEAMSDKDFGSFVAAAIEAKRRPDSNLSERTTRVWGQIVDNSCVSRLEWHTLG
jgi:secreted Zn-dependent insulinase-like peptidase